MNILILILMLVLGGQAFATSDSTILGLGNNSSIVDTDLIANWDTSAAITKYTTLADFKTAIFTSPSLVTPTADTLDTGNGANELFGMDQNVKTTSSPTFAGATLSSGSTTLGTILGTINATTATAFRVPNSTTLPATCTVGDIYFDTDATSGKRTYGCESANTWVSQSGTAGATNLSDIGAPTGNGSVAMAGYTQTFTSTLDSAAASVWTISDTDASLAASTSLLTLKFADVASANGLFVTAVDTSGGTPRTVFTLGASGKITTGVTGTGSIDIGSTGVRLTDDGDGALTMKSISAGSQEDLTLNLDDTANTAVFSTSTGVTYIDTGGIGIVPRVNTTASSATPAINVDTTDMFTITALAANITSMTSSLSGTARNGQHLTIRMLDNGTARTITWGASFASRGATLPTTTVLSKYLYAGFIYNSTTSTWDCVAVSYEA